MERDISESEKKLGVRHLQSVLLLSMAAIAFGTRAMMSIAIVAMTDSEYSNSQFSVFDWDSPKKSLILSCLLWGCIVTQIPIGYLTANGGSKRCLCSCFLLGGLATLATPVLASNYGWLAVIVCRIVVGMSQGCVSPCATKILSQWIPPDERARLVSMVMNAGQLGNALAMPIAGALASSQFGWPSIFYAFGTIHIVWAMLFLLLAADTPSEHPSICPEEKDYIHGSLGKLEKAAGCESQKLKFPWKSALKSVPVWSVVIVGCGHGFAYYVFLAELPSYMKYVLNYDIKESGFLSALPYLAMWLMGFPISWLCDYALGKGVDLTLVRKTTETIGTWGPSLGLIALGLVKTSDAFVYVIIIVVCMGLNAAVTCSHEINHIDLTPNFSGTLVSIINTLIKICGVVSPIVVGYFVTDMSDASQWSVIFYLTALIYFVTNLIFMIFGTAETQAWDAAEEPVTESSPSSSSAVKKQRISTASNPSTSEPKNNLSIC